MSKLLDVLVVEDEPIGRDILIQYISKIPFLRLAGVTSNSDEALEMVNKNKYDLAFLDINLSSKISGLDIARKISHSSKVIFTTGESSYAATAFDMDVVDYLLKPYPFERFQSAVDKIKRTLKKEDTVEDMVKGLLIRGKKGQYFILYDKVVYISSHNKHSVIHLQEQEIECSMLLKDIEEKLPANIFSRIHKQFIININFLSHIEYYVGGNHFAHINNTDNTTLPVGRKYADNLKLK